MAVTTITSNGTYLLGTARNAKGHDNWTGNLTIVGTANYGGGTLTIQKSYDNGTTRQQMQNTSGSSISYTTGNPDIAMQLQPGLSAILVYAVLTGATSPNLVLNFTHSSEF